MREGEILSTIERLAHDHLDWPGPVTPEMDLVEDLQLDSLKLLTLAVQVENHFQICFDPEEEAGIRRVSDLVSMIDQKLSTKTRG